MLRACLALLLAGAAASCCPAMGPPSVRLALDGPPLAIAAQGGAFDRGHMDRGSLAGVGSLRITDPSGSLVCEGTMDSPASPKGRLYAELTCNDGSSLSVAMRNLGPDQGMGVGRATAANGDSGERVLFFYHPSEEEARRRLEGIAQEMAGTPTAE